jgi:peroxiredoxin Q/BCP
LKLDLRSAWRTLAASASAVAAGLFNMATTTQGGERIRIEPGDAAPDFELPGSDGRSYRLRDFTGRRAVVIAWFPKAFTGG